MKIKLLLLLTMFISVAYAPMNAPVTYWVSTTGNDTNFGTEGSPFRTIQHAVNIVKPGDTINVIPGTYNEAISIPTSGTVTARIVLNCMVIKGCTINSGSSRTISFPPGQKGYWTINGFRLIASGDVEGINTALNYWGDGHLGTKGNDGFIITNNYIEGWIYLYGADNLVEFNEINGHGVVMECVFERGNPSENNIIRNNFIHDCVHRGGWSLQGTFNTRWEKNYFLRTGKNHGGEGVDCDGAGILVEKCDVIGNIFEDNQGEVAVLGENCFNCTWTYNIVFNSFAAFAAVNYNKENGDGFHADKDYQGLDTNTEIAYNVIYNIESDGIGCKAVVGNSMHHNTLYNVRVVRGYFGAISFSAYSAQGNYCKNWEVYDNIIANSPKTAFLNLTGNVLGMDIHGNVYTTFAVGIYNNTSKNFSTWQSWGYDQDGFIADPQFINPSSGDFRLQANSPACGKGAIPCGATVPPTPTRTPTGSPTPIPPSITPSKTATPSLAPVTLTPSPTITLLPEFTLTPTRTSTATLTPSASNLCAKIAWPIGVSIRPSFSLYSISNGTYFFNRIILIESIFQTTEIINGSLFVETWAKVNQGNYFAMKINKSVYAKLVVCS